MAPQTSSGSDRARHRLGIQDALWLEMDRPTNLMVADVVVWTSEPLDYASWQAVVTERMLDRYPVFRSRAVRDDDGSWWWEPDPDFDDAHHFSTASLERPDDPRCMQALVAANRTEMLGRNRPLWRAILVPRYGRGSAMILRSHHAMADGMRMVQLAMSLFDAAPEGGAILGPAVAQHGTQTRPPGGSTMTDRFSAVPGDLDTIRKLVVGNRNDVTIWSGTATGSKGVAWAPPLSLAAVKAVAKAHGCTVNDVLVATVACALHDYLQARQAHCSSVAFMVPVNLKPLDLSLPETLGNEFALVQLELPTDEPDPAAVLAVAARRMRRIKRSHEAAIAFRLQEAIAGFSRRLYRASVKLFTNRTLGVLTNVPGPPIPVYLAGALVEGIVGWAPVSGDQPMSFSICSYNGSVVVGIACDTELVPGFESIVDGFAAAFDRLVDCTPGVPRVC